MKVEIQDPVTRARLLENEGRLEEALEVLAALPEGPRSSADACYRMAHIYLQQGKLEQAESWLRQTLNLRFEDARAHTNLGVVLDLRGHHQDAIRAFRRAIQLAPDEPAAYLNLGAIYGELGRHEDAVRCLERCLELAPSYDAIFNLALVRLRQGELAPAESLLERALHESGDHPLAHYYLGLCRSRRGLLREAAEAFEAALACNEDLVRARYHLGKVHRRRGRTHDAVRELKKVAHALPDDAQVMRELGFAYDALSMKSESLQCFRRARMLDAADS